MNTTVPLSLSPSRFFDRLTPLTVGFDSLFKELDTFAQTTSCYPPHNIVRVNDTQVRIEFAVAGFDKSDISVVEDGEYLVITGKADDKELADGEEYHYKGISTRSFVKKFRLATDMRIKSAAMADGMLVVTVLKTAVEEKSKEIPIT